MKKFLKEFREFAVKGNAIDLAVGVIIGGAFGKIISSLVADIIMPPLGLLLGGVNFADLKITLQAAVTDASGAITRPAVIMNTGLFIQNILDFLIIAFVIFLMIKMLTNLKRKLVINQLEETIPMPLTKDQELLIEMRDALKK
jgi:large conductance mechanosensitive channel